MTMFGDRAPVGASGRHHGLLSANVRPIVPLNCSIRSYGSPFNGEDRGRNPFVPRYYNIPPRMRIRRRIFSICAANSSIYDFAGEFNAISSMKIRRDSSSGPGLLDSTRAGMQFAGDSVVSTASLGPSHSPGRSRAYRNGRWAPKWPRAEQRIQRFPFGRASAIISISRECLQARGKSSIRSKIARILRNRPVATSDLRAVNLQLTRPNRA